MTQIVLIFIGVLVMVLGMILLVRGLRGRVVDDHPICRRCGFDLFGRPQGVNICSECGGDLRLPGAIQQGHRVRRKPLVATGAGLIALVVLTWAGTVWMAYSSSNLQSYLPVWCLMIETRSGIAATRVDALKELNTRLGAGSLSQSQIDDVVDRALTAQADRNKTWLLEWGDFVESADAANKLSADRWTRYLVEAAEIKLKIRPRVRIGDPLPYQISQTNARIGNRPNLVVRFSKQIWQIGPVRIERNNSGGLGLGVNGSSSTASSIELKKHLDQLHPGPAEVRLEMELKIARNWDDPPMATKKFDLINTVTFLPADQPAVTINHDPSFRAGVEKAISVKEAMIRPGNPASLDVRVRIGQLPVDIGYDVYTTIHGKEVKIGGFALPAVSVNGGSWVWGLGGEVPEFDDETIDLVFKPSVDAAIRTTTIFEIWDGQIELKNIPVNRPPKPASAPATTKPSLIAPAI